LRHEGRSIAERCAVRQRKLDMARKMRFDLSLKVIAAISHTIPLPLLFCGFSLHVWFPDAPTTYPAIALVAIGTLSFLALTVAGMPDASPFWTRWSAPVTPTAMSGDWKTTSDDVRCISQIIRSNTNKKAFDAVIPHAVTIPWFKDGLDTEPPHDIITSMLVGCFGSSGRLRPGLRDRAYHSARALLWLYTCARCESAELAQGFPLPNIHCPPTLPDPDIQHLLTAYDMQGIPIIISWMLSRFSPFHSFSSKSEAPKHSFKS